MSRFLNFQLLHDIPGCLQIPKAIYTSTKMHRSHSETYKTADPHMTDLLQKHLLRSFCFCRKMLHFHIEYRQFIAQNWTLLR